MADSSLESQHTSAQNEGKHVLPTSIFQNFPVEHAFRPPPPSGAPRTAIFFESYSEVLTKDVKDIRSLTSSQSERAFNTIHCLVYTNTYIIELETARLCFPLYDNQSLG